MIDSMMPLFSLFSLVYRKFLPLLVFRRRRQPSTGSVDPGRPRGYPGPILAFSTALGVSCPARLIADQLSDHEPALLFGYLVCRQLAPWTSLSLPQELPRSTGSIRHLNEARQGGLHSRVRGLHL